MREIDERVVEMQFDNKQFERGASQSISTLERLKNALHFGESAKSLSSISTIASHMNLSGIEAGLSAIQSRFSTLGIIGMRVIQNLTDSVMNLASKFVHFSTSGIIEGGFKRASNIENAKFQIEGLGYAWEDVEKQVNFAVNQTAYGLDSAAKAAAILLASGVKTEKTFDGTASTADQMATTLRAISGVAAQTNSDYDSMANIFTTVAGNGRLMGDQLNQLAYRGLNAAATIANYFNRVNKGELKVDEATKKMVRSVSTSLNTTEEQIRDFVSKGKVSAELFSKIMYDEFGEHAVKANETLTGSLSNVRAALARIGQAFYTPLIEQNGPLVKLFNALRLKVNELKGDLTESNGVIERLVEIAIAIVNKARKIVERADFTRIVENLNNALAIARNEIIRLGQIFVPVKELFEDFFPEKPFIILSDWLAKIKRSVTRTSQMGTENGDLVPGLNQKKLQVVEKAAPVLSSTIDYIKRIAKGVFAGARLGAEAIAAIFEESKPLIDTLKDVGSGFAEVAGRIADWLVRMYEAVGGTDFFNKKIQGIKNFVKGLVDAFERVTGIDVKAPTGQTVIDFFENIIETAKNLKDWIDEVIFKINYITGLNIHMPSGEEIIQSFENVLLKIKDLKEKFDSLKQNISETFSKLHDDIERVTGIDIRVPSINDLKWALEDIRDTIDTVKEKIKSLVEDENGNKTSFGQFLENIKKSFQDFHVDLSGFNEFISGFNEGFHPLEAAFGAFSIAFQWFFNVLTTRIIPGLEKAWDKLKEIATDIWNGLKNLFSEEGDLGDILKDSVFVIALFKLKDILEQLNELLDGTTIIGKINSVADAFKGFISNLAGEKEAFGDIKTIAGAILMLSISLAIIASIDIDKMGAGLVAITAFLGEFYGMMKLMSKVDINDDIGSASNALLKMSIAIGVLALSVKSLGKMSWGDMAKGLISVTVLLYEMTKVTERLASKDQKSFTKGVGGLILMAVALRIVASSIKTLGNMEFGAILQGGVAVLILIATLSDIAERLSKSGEKMTRGIGGLVLMAIAIKILASAIEQLGKVPVEELENGFIAVTVLLIELTVVAERLSKSSGSMAKGARGILLIAIAIRVLLPAIQAMGDMSWDQIGKSLLVFTGTLGFVVAMLAALSEQQSQKGAKGVGGIAASILIAAVAIRIMASALKAVASIDKGLFGSFMAIAGLISVLAVALSTMDGKVVGNAAGLLIVSVALIALAGALKIISTIDGTMIVGSLLAIAAALLIFMVAGKAMQVLNLEGTLAVLAGEFLVFAAACALLGVAIVAISAGLAALGPSLTVAVLGILEAVKILLVGIVDLAADLVLAAANLLVALAKGLILATPAVVNAIVVVVTAIMLGLSQLIPAVVKLALDLVKALLYGIAYALPDIMQAAALIIYGLLEGLADNIDAIIQGGIDLMIAFINGMAEGIRASQGSIMDAIMNLTSAMIEFLLTGLQKVFEGIPVIGEKVVDGLETAKGKVREVLAPESMKEIGEEASSNVIDGWTGTRSELNAAADETGNTLVDGIRSKEGDVKLAAGGLNDVFSRTLYDGSGNSYDAASEMSGSAVDALAATKEEFGDVGDMDVQSYLDAFSGDYDFAGMGLKYEALSGLAGGEDQAAKEGKNTSNAYANSLASSTAQSKTKRGAVRMAQSAIDGARSKYNAMVETGSYLADGARVGLERKSALLAAAAGKMVSNAIGRMRSVAVVASPSKVTTKIGEYIGEGLLNGMSSFSDKVENAGGDLSSSALFGINSIAGKINDLLNSELNADPTIRPVLDLSEIQNGTGLLNSMLASSSYGLNLAGNITGFTSRSQESLDTIMDRAITKAMDTIGTKLTETVGGQSVTIEVPLYMDGREVARVTAPYTRTEINKLDTRASRREGVA